MNNCTYIFIDEAGDFDFSIKGSRFFILTSLSMHRQSSIISAIDDYKYHCLETGRHIEYFHCSQDRWDVRNSLFKLIANHINDLRIDCLVVEKDRNGVRKSAQNNMYLYLETLGRLLQIVIPRELAGGTKQVIVITDAIPVEKKRKIIEKTIKTTLSNMLPAGTRYHLLHHQSRSHYGLQITDYCCWAIFRKWQQRGDTWYKYIQPALCNELIAAHDGAVSQRGRKILFKE